MKKWGPVAMLAVGVIVALWAAVNSLLLQGAGPERAAAEKALREQLGVPESSGNEPGPPPMPVEEPPSDDGEAQLSEDLLERWRKVIEQVDGVFDRDDDPDIEYFRQRLCISYQWPIDWSLERMDVLEGFLEQNEALVHEIVALTKLGIPSSSTIEELAISIAKESKDDEAIFVSGSSIAFDCLSLLTVASAIETRMGDFDNAGESLSAALRWVDKDTGMSWARGIDLTALDVSAEGIFRSGALSAEMLSEMEPVLEPLVDRQKLAKGVADEGRYLLWDAQRSTWEREYYLKGKVIAFAQKTFAGSLYSRSETRAFEHAGRLAALAPRPYYEIRDELAAMDEEARPRWYNSSVPNITELNLGRNFVYQARWEARRDMVGIAIALEQRYDEMNAYPESLEAIASALDGRVPVDVFTGDAYRYRATDEGFMLYSSGRNGVDDTGEGDDVVLRRTRD